GKESGRHLTRPQRKQGHALLALRPGRYIPPADAPTRGGTIMPWWPLDPMTLMWIQVATGFTGAMTLTFLFRVIGRKLGTLLSMEVFFSPKGGCQTAAVAEIKKAK